MSNFATLRHGRTEAIRPVTSETREFCQALAEKTAEKSYLFGLLKKCSSVHSQLTQSAAKGQNLGHAQLWMLGKGVSMFRPAFKIFCILNFSGQGWDRHLFALKNVHLTEYGDSKPLPDVFTDEAYQNINQNKISTSTLGPVKNPTLQHSKFIYLDLNWWVIFELIDVCFSFPMLSRINWSHQRKT